MDLSLHQISSTKLRRSVNFPYIHALKAVHTVQVSRRLGKREILTAPSKAAANRYHDGIKT